MTREETNMQATLRREDPIDLTALGNGSQGNPGETSVQPFQVVRTSEGEIEVQYKDANGQTMSLQTAQFGDGLIVNGDVPGVDTDQLNAAVNQQVQSGNVTQLDGTGQPVASQDQGQGQSGPQPVSLSTLDPSLSAREILGMVSSGQIVFEDPADLALVSSAAERSGDYTVDTILNNREALGAGGDGVIRNGQSNPDQELADAGRDPNVRGDAEGQNLAQAQANSDNNAISQENAEAQRRRAQQNNQANPGVGMPVGMLAINPEMGAVALASSVGTVMNSDSLQQTTNTQTQDGQQQTMTAQPGMVDDVGRFENGQARLSVNNRGQVVATLTSTVDGHSEQYVVEKGKDGQYHLPPSRYRDGEYRTIAFNARNQAYEKVATNDIERAINEVAERNNVAERADNVAQNFNQNGPANGMPANGGRFAAANQAGAFDMQAAQAGMTALRQNMAVSSIGAQQISQSTAGSVDIRLVERDGQLGAVMLDTNTGAQAYFNVEVNANGRADVVGRSFGEDRLLERMGLDREVTNMVREHREGERGQDQQVAQNQNQNQDQQQQQNQDQNQGQQNDGRDTQPNGGEMNLASGQGIENLRNQLGEMGLPGGVVNAVVATVEQLQTTARTAADNNIELAAGNMRQMPQEFVPGTAGGIQQSQSVEVG